MAIGYSGLKSLRQLAQQSSVELGVEHLHLLENAVQLPEVKELAVAIPIYVESGVEVLGLVPRDYSEMHRSQRQHLILLHTGLYVGGLDKDVAA